MNYSTSDYLTQLQQDREDLVDNLEAKGIQGLTGDETFTQLVPQVLNIPSGSGGLDWSAIGYSGTPQDIIDEYNYSKNIYDNWENVSSLNQKFRDDTTLVYMPLVDTSNATDTQQMFYYCANLTIVPLLDTGNVKFMNNMFASCSRLTSIAQFDTGNVTNMSSMFQNCTNLTTIPQFDTSKVTTMQQMFQGCTKLTTVPQLNTSKVTNLSTTFRNCSSLNDTSLDNILKMCININPNYSRTKKLSELGFTSSYYPATRIQALPSYQDFIDAGWTIGY